MKRIMIDTTYTPGPWLIENATVYALQDSDPPHYRDGKLEQENRFYCLVQYRYHVPETERKATIRLIASSPKLHAALSDLLDNPTDAGAQFRAASVLGEVEGNP